LDKTGKAIKHYSEIKIGDTLTTILADGQLTSSVNNFKKSDNE
jgi:hypothetical protein